MNGIPPALLALLKAAEDVAVATPRPREVPKNPH